MFSHVLPQQEYPHVGCRRLSRLWIYFKSARKSEFPVFNDQKFVARLAREAVPWFDQMRAPNTFHFVQGIIVIIASSRRVRTV